MKEILHRWSKLHLLSFKRSISLQLVILTISFLFSSSNAWSQCTDAPPIAGVSNITTTTARVNWNAVPGTASPTYTLEVYTDAGMTIPFGTFTGIATNSYNLTALAANTTYYFQVKVDNTTCGLYGTGNFVAQLGYTPIDVTGFSADVIANGVGSPLNTSTHSVDNINGGGANFAYLALDYKLAAGDAAVTFGLPVSRSLSSPDVTGLKYILQDYSSNNSLRLSATNDFGVLTFTQPMQLTNLYLGVASGDSGSVISVEIQFADNTTQTVTGLAVTNWDSNAPANSPAIISNIGRVKRVTGVANSGNFKIFQISIPVELANQSKLINAIKITKTNTSAAESQIPNIFAVSGKLLAACPSLNSVSATTNSFTSATLNWTLGSAGINGTNVTYTVEVYTDAAYTTPIPGSPFTGLTATSQQITGLTLGTTYYYRVKANNGTCDSDYLTGTLTPAYCTPTSSSTLYHITNFTTTGGYTNIANTTGGSNYTNYATQTVSKPAGTSFSFNGTRSSTIAKLNVYVDWNQDLDFDDANETVATIGTGVLPYSGTITIPSGTPLGNYRLRLRSAGSSVTITPCGNLGSGEAEDYTIAVVTQPADCTTPNSPTIALSNITVSGITGTITAPATAPTGYLLIRSTAATLSETPQAGSTYAAGAVFGGGTVVSVSPTLTTFTDFLAANTRYYYFVYSFNEGGTSCFGPIYSADPATANATTCAKAAIVASASNVTANNAVLNWSSIVGEGGATATYTVEVYTDAALTTQLGSYTATTNSYSLSGLSNGSTYYYRVKGSTATCFNDAWSAVANFTAQNNYTPVTVTGFNADVIANGTGIAKVSTTNSVDAVSNAYIALDYERISGTVTTIGLPLNRTLTSTPIPALRFLMQDYGSNNALRLPAQNQAGTLSFTQPLKVSDLYLAVTSGSGGSSISAVINFQDNTSQTIANINLIDWYAAATTAQPALVSNIGRVSRADNNGVIETGNSKVFYTTLAIDAANQAKAVTSVTITKTSTGATEPVPNIFAVSAKLIDECPAITSATAAASATGATVSWINSTTATAATSYTLEVYTDVGYTQAVTGSPFTGITATSYNVTGLNPTTIYYFRVKAINSACTSAYVSNNFTTPCQAPAAPTATAQTICGPSTVAALSATLATSATANWYNVETGGSALAATTAIATGTYYVSQTLNSCESARTAVTVIVTTVTAPDAIASQTFCPGATVAQLSATAATGATLTWSLTQGGAALASTTQLATGTYYATQTIGSCTSPATTVAVTVSAINAPTATAQALCAGATVANLVVTGATGATFTWSATQGGTALASSTLLATGTYYVTQTVGSCTSTSTTVNVTVNTVPAPTASAQVFCNGATVSNLIVTGAAGATFTWSATQGGTTLASNTLLASGTYFVTQTVNGCTSPVTSVQVTVNSTAAPIAAAQTFCNSATVAQLVVTTLPGATFTWSTTEGGAALSSTTALISGTYYVTQTLNGCVSTATSVLITVNITPQPTAVAQTFCAGATVSDLEANASSGATLTWYATQGGLALTGSEQLVSGTYFVTQTLNGCTSSLATVSVIVNTTPAPSADEQTFCAGATVAQLQATPAGGATLTWYATQNGTPLAGSEALVNNTYYVTQTLNGCTSTATAVAVSVNTVATPNVSAQTFCNGATVADLTAEGATEATLTWYATQDGGALTGSETLSSGTYFVTQTLEGCTSLPAAVSVTVNFTAEPEVTAQQFCGDITGIDLFLATDFAYTWYNQPGGDIISETDALTTGTYYVTQTNNGCESTPAPVSITVNAIPVAPAGEATQTFVAGETVEDLEIETATGATVTWYVLDGENYVTVGNDALLADGMTYYAAQSVATCTSDYLAVTVSVVAGRDSYSLKDLKVYPNPTRDMVTVATDGNITKVSVINLLGQTVIEKATNNTSVPIDLSSLPGGNYILQVSGEGTSTNVKVVKY